jgi:hypothetical protein
MYENISFITSHSVEGVAMLYDTPTTYKGGKNEEGQ